MIFFPWPTILVTSYIFEFLKTQYSTLCIHSKDPDSPGFDPRTRAFSEEELRPQPILRKRKKQYVSDEMKNEQYWQKRIKNNTAARKSREAKRLRENQVSFLTIKGNNLRYVGLSLMGNDIGTGRTEGMEPIKRLLTYLLSSVTHILYHNKIVQNWRF